MTPYHPASKQRDCFLMGRMRVQGKREGTNLKKLYNVCCLTKFVGRFQCNHSYKSKAYQQPFICKCFQCVQPHVGQDTTWLTFSRYVSNHKHLHLFNPKALRFNTEKKFIFLQVRIVHRYDPLQTPLSHTHTVAVQMKIKP